MKPIVLKVQPPSYAPEAGGPSGFSPALLLSQPHRLFFACAMLLLIVAATLWSWMVLGRAGIAPPPVLGAASPVWHVLAMLDGAFAFFMFGFLFTAGQRWLDVASPPASHWRPAALVALAGVLVLLLAPTEGAARAGAALLGLGWLALDLAFWRLVRASPAQDRVHATLVGLALLAGASGPLSYAALGNEAYPWLVLAGLWLFAVPVFVVVCHRMIPFFTANVLPTVAIFRPWWLLAALVAGPLLHGSLATMGLAAWTWIVDLPLALLAFDLARRWGLAQSMGNRLLAMLHLGFVWYAVAFLLEAVASFAVLAGRPSLGAAGTHALGMGFCGSLMIAMVSRVTLGHSGRTLAADRATWWLFLLLQVAVVVRIGAALWPHPLAVALAALLWTACAVPWALRYLPVYARPRADGKPG